MEGQNKIAEDPRGVFDSQQNLEPNMVDILDEKLKEFGGEADAYRKKSEDMRMLTALEKKRENEEAFTKDDLILLYEINGTIEGFGYQKDPRIAELRQGRNAEEDMLVIFECARDEIAHVPSQIQSNTKAYVGQLEPGIFRRLPENLEHVYTSFPDKKIRRENVEIGGKSAEQLISEMQRAQILGLELCPADTGPNYRLRYRNQPLNEWIYMSMKQIAGSDGGPSVFELVRNDGGLWLDGHWAGPDGEWGPGREFVFRLRKSES
ncbi:hypothetical protein HYR65_01130 [Candidatus Azambacteria bacterium]|nr:hypothetical protein [Candidatus Azambacteria bacterium]